MVASLPLFKLGALFLRHISKYGANHIKLQAHEHPKFRAIAAKYGQTIHQITMRVSVAAMRNSAAEKRRKELAEAPTVKTKEQVEAEEAKAKAKAEEAAKHGTHPKTITYEADTSIWKRKFRPLPEAKAVDLFADVIGDAFILTVAVSLLMYEYIKARSKPDANAERIKELAEQLEAEQQKIAELEDAEKQRQARLEVLEKSLEEMRRGPVEKIKRAMTHS